MASTAVLIPVLLSLLSMHVVSAKEDAYLQQLQEKVIRMQEKLAGYLTELGITEEEPIPKVAFFATMNVVRTTYSALATIQFENVVTNVGDGFDSSSGVFRAPVNSTYFFQSTLLSDNAQEIWAYLTVNGNTMSKLNAHGVGGRHGTGTQSMLVELTENDEVKLINQNAGAKYYGNAYSSFSGYQL